MKKVLFVCVENSCRSQIAEGWARALGKAEFYSAGSRPSGVVNKDAINIMSEVNIDISGHKSKGFDGLPVKSFDYVVTMGCGDVCPFVPASKRLDWAIPDPKGKDLAFFRQVRTTIHDRVVELINELKSP